MGLTSWAIEWGISAEAVADLRARLGEAAPDPAEGVKERAGGSEAGAQSRVRLAAANHGWYLWRNNSGGFYDETGRFVRYGLGNDSKKINEVMKSHDLVGLRPVLIRPDHVGHTLGQFVSREVKPPGWHYRGTGREAAQKAFGDVVNRLGGDARFTTGDLF